MGNWKSTRFLIDFADAVPFEHFYDIYGSGSSAFFSKHFTFVMDDGLRYTCNWYLSDSTYRLNSFPEPTGSVKVKSLLFEFDGGYEAWNFSLYIDTSYWTGYSDGYNEGYDDGDEAYDKGYEVGYDVGNKDGFDAGKIEGIAQGKNSVSGNILSSSIRSFAFALFDAPVDTFLSTFNFEYDGFNIGALVAFIFTGVVVVGVLKVVLCNSKFCDGCQSAISQRRYERFEPLIEELQKTHDVAHVVITVPNCKSKDLYQTLQRMYETRKYFIRFLQGSDCIRGIDLKKYGFHGGIMALEISRNDKDGTFHPHFHCCFVFERKSGVFDRRHTVVNSYSFNNAHYKGKKGDTVRMFNQFEILLQKIWRLRYDGVEVNRHTIAALKEGYSVIVERKENFKEVFKYATKGVLRWNKDVQRVLGNYTDFVHLDYSLYSRRLIQTYGIFRGIPLPETVDQDEQDDRYKRIIDGLRFLEDPIEQREYLESILEQQESQNIKYISRHNIAALLSSDEGGSDA